MPASEIGGTLTLATEFLRYDPAAPVATDLSGLPKDAYAPGIGAFIYRQSWTDPTATMWQFRSGTLTESHSALDANTLRIWKGSFWVTSDANIYSQSGIVQQTYAYNSMTVGGIGQSHIRGGVIAGAPQVSNSLVVVRGQAKDAYWYPPNYTARSSIVNDYLRTVAYLPQQDSFVVVDRVTAASSTAQKVWRWQSKNPAVISGNTFTITNPNGDQRCVGTVLLPTNAVLGNQPMTLGVTGDTTTVTSNAVTVTLPTGNASAVVVTTIQCSAIQLVTAVSNSTNITTTIGGNQVVVPLDETQAVTLR